MIKAIDFFCGAGGLTRGLLDAGINVVAGVDNDERLQKTYEANNAPSRFIARDIAEVDLRELRSQLALRSEDAVLYAACTPCQPFSTLNTMKGADPRKYLLLDFARLVAASPPDFILVENVPGINNALGKEIYDEFVGILDRHGFRQDAARLDAKDFGVPQTRKRFIMIASRHGRPTLPNPLPQERFNTVRNAISKYPFLADGAESPLYKNHVSKKLLPHHQRIVAAVPPDGGNRRDVADASILLQCHQRHPRAHRNVFSRMAWDQPGPTLTSRCVDVYCGRFTHPEQNRGISLREAAALQTFPDHYEFFGKSIQENARQIGNAVPVKLAKTLGQAVTDALTKSQESK